MESLQAKCTGVKLLDWLESLSEWYRRTWTLQEDPCKKYHEVMMVDPILRVPPIKAIEFTIISTITDPLKQIGQGFSEFIRALLDGIPVTLQIPVLLIISAQVAETRLQTSSVTLGLGGMTEYSIKMSTVRDFSIPRNVNKWAWLTRRSAN
ncbi:putative chloride channel CLIC-like protein 1 [Triplophysa rosa]|uniref:Chloride channel CLIC-like protein 1 n=1 Tax=Triplophysa rosa TaxID=992332 RepID=A0A9W7X2T9_TRIRA|nr:putative chloride channel CLIC-like protein 1 [Triplophysa rosa]